MSESEIAEIDLLTSLDNYLAAGCHIGTHMKTEDMEPFVYRQRPTGVYVLDVRKTDERLRVAAKFIARFEPSKVAVVSGRLYGKRPVETFAHYVGAYAFTDRFVPGTLTNPNIAGPRVYVEPELVILTDPRTDQQALSEASRIGVPVVALCDTDNVMTNVDLVIPTNNRGRKALALVYYLLTRQVLIERGDIPEDAEPAFTPEDFEPQAQRL
ncbi:MAG TPA: 30S ribosomal protein S2 [Candidatus Thorarchaeota archaeon]|nr:MAG: 30S ribosomal protein S2 [Candidatus Thorarchaeota archaeon]RLI62281.1 MAG: 30S ribosomal protein S2 [Candidatus Thorarchaeota archaeon]HDD67627.1 30S ribosomal protein S2 [Candidatus Thorarchaeota archaeon]